MTDPAPSALDELFRSPLSEFVSRRNDLVKRLKKEGHKEAAAEIKSLTKPAVSAWVVNQLYFWDPEGFGELLEIGQSLRKGPEDGWGGLGAQGLQAAHDRRRAILSNLLERAQAVLSEAGHAANPSIMQRVSTTLDALAAQGEGQPQAGRLSRDLEAPGFDLLSGVVVAPPPPRPSPDAEKSQPASESAAVEPEAREEAQAPSSPATPPTKHAPAARPRSESAGADSAAKPATPSPPEPPPRAIDVKREAEGRRDVAAARVREATAALEKSRKELAIAEAVAEEAEHAYRRAEDRRKDRSRRLERAEGLLQEAREELEAAEEGLASSD